MITKEIEVSRLNINPKNKTVSVQVDTVIMEDGVELSRAHHRASYAPGDIEIVKDVLSDPEVAYLESIWTEAVIEAYQASQEEEAE